MCYYLRSSSATERLSKADMYLLHHSCFFYPESAGDLGKIENPQTINRDEFFRRYWYSHLDFR